MTEKKYKPESLYTIEVSDRCESAKFKMHFQPGVKYRVKGKVATSISEHVKIAQAA